MDDLTAHPTTTSSSPLVSSLLQIGYVIIPSLLSPSEILVLRGAATQSTTLARTGTYPYVRTLPHPFPPWATSPLYNPPKAGIWGVQQLLHPSLPAHDTFAAHYFSTPLISIVKELLECDNTSSTNSDDELIMELFNLLIRPDADFSLPWHRDEIPSSACAEEERIRLWKHEDWKPGHVQWNLALYPDASLLVIPGSHLRPRTLEERTVSPYGHMPGQVVVKLEAGDAVFYDNNILHRGVYDRRVERLTLHASVGHVRGGKERARGIWRHGTGEWVEGWETEGLAIGIVEKKRAEGMRIRLMEMGRRNGIVDGVEEEGKEVGGHGNSQ